MHHREMGRPSSTGHLIHRTFEGARHHLWRRERRLKGSEIRVAGRDLWILHPSGHPAPQGATPGSVQLLLLDASWRETRPMVREVVSWGRLVSLPMEGESRFLLRNQPEEGRFSTVEALLFLLRSFGLEQAHSSLLFQFELHVYASLRSRGRKAMALDFLKQSSLEKSDPVLVGELNRPRLFRLPELKTV